MHNPRDAKAFKLGERTGIKLPSEVSGLIPTEAWKLKRQGQVWTAGESLSVAIGQGAVLMTVLQTANLYATIAVLGILGATGIVGANQQSQHG